MNVQTVEKPVSGRRTRSGLCGSLLQTSPLASVSLPVYLTSVWRAAGQPFSREHDRLVALEDVGEMRGN